MASTGFQPSVDALSGLEFDPEERRLHVELQERAQEARDAAREAVAHSQELRWLVREWKVGTFTSRCAWCRRYRVGDRWLEAARTPPVRVSRTTHTICDDCAAALREAGLSA
jgi:hypothetical protein